MLITKKFRGDQDLKLKIENLKKDHKRNIQIYKNIIDQKELEIEQYKNQNKDLKKKIKEEKKYSKMLYESP